MGGVSFHNRNKSTINIQLSDSTLDDLTEECECERTGMNRNYIIESMLVQRYAQRLKNEP